jgi:cold shock CspA family protein
MPLLGATAESGYGYHTAAQITLDDLRDSLEFADQDTSDQMTERRVVELARDFEQFTQEGLQKFPLNEHLLALESQYRLIVDQYGRAEAALRKAFEANPRQDWIAIRLARTLAGAGKYGDAKSVLVRCLEANPTSRRGHFELALLYMREPTPNTKEFVFDHLRRSFVAGDPNYEAQFWYAREAFLRGQHSDAEAVFQALRNSPMPPDIKNKIRATIDDESGHPRIYSGEIVTVEYGYMFLRCVDIPENVFVHRSRITEDPWERFRRGSKVVFTVGFSMRGATAASVRLLEQAQTRR